MIPTSSPGPARPLTPCRITVLFDVDNEEEEEEEEGEEEGTL